MTTSDRPTRRAILLKIGVLFNAAVGAMLAVPVLRYVLSPVTRQRKQGDGTWISLGSLNKFPAGQTRLAPYQHPSATPSDGETASSQSTARTWVVQCVGSRNPICSCVPATGAPTTKTAREPRVPPREDCLSTATKSSEERSSSKLVRCPPPGPRRAC